MRTGWMIAAALTVPLAAQTVDYTAVEKAAVEELAALNIPGASIAIVRGDKVVYSKAFG